MKSLSEFAMSKTNNFREPKNLAMVVTYTFAEDDDFVVDDFVELLEKLKFRKGEDQSTYELASIHRSRINKIEKDITDWIKDNSDNINEGNHITMYKPITVQNKYTDERYPVIKKTKWKK